MRLHKLLEMLDKQPNDTFLTYAVGMEHLGNNNDVEAQQWFEKTLSIEPDNIATHYQLALLYHKYGKDKEAINLLEKGMVLAKNKGDLKTSNEFRTALDEIIF